MYISKKMLVLMAFAVVLGTIIGLVIASSLNFTPDTKAGAYLFRENIALGDNAGRVEENDDLLQSRRAFVSVARLVTPSVVSITSERKVERTGRDFFHFWRDDRENDNSDEQPRTERQSGLGSGVIIHSDGYIVTNNHVIDGADKIYVTIDRQRYDAEIVGRDTSTDLAVIKIDADSSLPAIAIGNSDKIEVGEWVLAVGNPFSIALQHTITAGIVSGIGRANVLGRNIEYEDFIQTDAAINPGNSGGALVNLSGELIGINTAIYSRGMSSGNIGIGFAIPSNLVSFVARQLIAGGRVIRGWLGVQISSLDMKTARAYGLKRPLGALVSGKPTGPAAAAGVMERDIIVGFAGVAIKDHNHLMHVVARHKPGEEVPVEVIHENGERETLTVVLGDRDASLYSESRARQQQRRRSQSLIPGLTLRALDAELARMLRIEPGVSGLVILEVDKNSEAASEGVEPGDIITAVNGTQVAALSDLEEILQGDEKNLLVQLLRDDEKFFVALSVE